MKNTLVKKSNVYTTLHKDKKYMPSYTEDVKV